MSTIRIPRDAVARMLAHARAGAPRESCGLLIGRAGEIVEAMPARNLADSPTRYLVDPADHFKALRSARARGLDVVGAYHSHPATPATPSQTDIGQANNGPDFLYVIVSLLNDEVCAYKLTDGLVAPCPLDYR